MEVLATMKIFLNNDYITDCSVKLFFNDDQDLNNDKVISNIYKSLSLKLYELSYKK
jgi:hypothetical protein